MKKIKEIFESTLLIEAKKLMVLDTLAASESDKIKEVLKKDKIKFTQTGSILSLEIDPNSPKAAVLRSHLHKIAKFDEIKERTVLVHRENDLTEASTSKNGKQAIKDFQKALKKGKIAFARPEFIGNWRYSDINESWGVMAETDQGLEVYILFSYFPEDNEMSYSLYDGKNTSETNSIGIVRNYIDQTPAAYKEMVADIKEDLDDLDETVNLESINEKDSILKSVSDKVLNDFEKKWNSGMNTTAVIGLIKAATGKKLKDLDKNVADQIKWDNDASALSVGTKILNVLKNNNLMEAANSKSSFECMECGHKFKKKIGKGEVRCPKCKSVDLEVE